MLGVVRLCIDFDCVRIYVKLKLKIENFIFLLRNKCFCSFLEELWV